MPPHHQEGRAIATTQKINPPAPERTTPAGDRIRFKSHANHASMWIEPVGEVAHEIHEIIRQLQDAGHFMSGHILQTWDRSDKSIGADGIFRGRAGVYFLRIPNVDVMDTFHTIERALAGDTTPARLYIQEARDIISGEVAALNATAVNGTRAGALDLAA